MQPCSILQTGKHNELMAKRGLYYDLVRQQEKHGAAEDATAFNIPNTAEFESADRNTSSNTNTNTSQQRSNMAQG